MGIIRRSNFNSIGRRIYFWVHFAWAVLGLGIVIAAMILLRGQRNHFIALPEIPAGRSSAREPRIVSLVPQATEILASMGCADHLAAVSNVDDCPAAKGLPRVGDYQTTDWETIAGLHPQWIITHFGVNRVPAGFTDRATALGIRQLNLLTETIDSSDQLATIEDAIAELGNACQQPDNAARAAYAFRSTLNAVAAEAALRPKVRALIVIGAEGTMVAGSDTFLSQALQYAGGTNAAAGLAGRYPSIDREELLALHPDAILQLLPHATPQVIRQANDFWARMPQIPAVRDQRVVQFTEWYAELAGCHTADLAEAFFKALHPSSMAPVAPTTRPIG